MCCLIVEIGLFILGVIGIAKGTVALTRTRVVSGTPARVIGVIFLLPLPAYIVANLIAGVALFGGGGEPDPQTALGVGLVALMALSVTILAVVIGTVLAFVYARPVGKTRRIREDDEDDRPRRSRRARDDDEEEEDEDRPRRPRRDDDDDDRDRGDEHVKPKG
ncbi:MAG TPA: hypothetical protein VKA46_17105 [Gemmataceae bacterium]|nr:hypothetical protein [Gemmataceae bacterium]